MKYIKIKFKDGTDFKLQADNIKVTSRHITLNEEKNRFWTTIKLSEVESYEIE